jgi:hypothetical protein
MHKNNNKKSLGKYEFLTLCLWHIIRFILEEKQVE